MNGVSYQSKVLDKLDRDTIHVHRSEFQFLGGKCHMNGENLTQMFNVGSFL